MNLQKELENFNNKIKVDFKIKDELIEKRNILLNKLKENKDFPSFTSFNQGSYAMFTGIEPEDGGEYDIDVALIFDKYIYENDPMEIKRKIYEIFKNHTEIGSEIKEPCVTVTYKKEGEAAFHVDLVVYLKDVFGKLHIAKGKNDEESRWEKADPKGLVEYINKKIVDKDEKEQCRRIVRYLKKWKSQKFSKSGHANPPSIGITLMVFENFVYYHNNDLLALLHVVKKIKDRFIFIRKDEFNKMIYKIKLSLPEELYFEEGNNIFGKMTENQMTDFKIKLEKIENDLIDVNKEIEEREKYLKLNSIFGNDFDVPDFINTSKRQNEYIPYSSASGRGN